MPEHAVDRGKVRIVMADDAEALIGEAGKVGDLVHGGRHDDEGLLTQDRDGRAVDRQEHILGRTTAGMVLFCSSAAALLFT